ncbi:uncharacterized protein [Trachinotus anak]|uniref:uncharacterized protein n=1 Tax=Trachinotus anak TaxID=443729 RepID=UPI0039F1B63D
MLSFLGQMSLMMRFRRIPPVNVHITYALGITTLFPNLKDPDSKNGYSGSSYLAWRWKTVQRNSEEFKKSKSTFQHCPKTPCNMLLHVKQLSGDECKEAMSVIRHSADMKLVKDNMKATFQYRQKVIQDPATASTVLDLFPRFLYTSGLIDQDFTMLFGEEVSGKFLAKWPTFFKPRIITECQKLPQSAQVDELLPLSWLAYLKKLPFLWNLIFIPYHLLPPTSRGRKSSKVSTSDAADRLKKFMKVGRSMETFLKETGPAQPFLLCVGERKNSIQNHYIVLDQKVIPCMTQTGVAAFDELFKSHFAFSLSYDEPLFNFYTFIQTSMYGIDVGSVRESPRVKEIRARILYSAI